MTSIRSRAAKVPTGITGFDEVTGGGLPHGRTTLLVGGPGSGKTILAMQFLVNGARRCREPGIFVAFEESAKRVLANMESFGWKLPELQRNGLYIMDAQPTPDLVQSGDFDLSGMLAALEAKIREMRARRIVFDALDIVLALLPDPAAKRREVYRLHEWLLAHELTGLITAKAGWDESTALGQQPFGVMQFTVDCVVILTHSVFNGVSRRNLRVQKYRGSGFDEDESPFLIDSNGIEVAIARKLGHVDAFVTDERVSSGVQRLDTMLHGGYYRGASVLITGSAGTGKTTLTGAFCEAACRRGERTLFVSFDSDGPEVIRNLSSVGVRLHRFVKSGLLRVISARAIAGSADTYLERIKSLANEHKARCLVVDPMSTWSKNSNDVTEHSVADRLIDWSKGGGITLICTRLVDAVFSNVEPSSPLQISTLVDTWIHLNYLLQGGERNRGLAIIKSRGTAHSNQVREMILSDTGVTLTDTYTTGGESLMGTLRWEKEERARTAGGTAAAARKLKRLTLDAEEAKLVLQLKSIQAELLAKQAEKALRATATLDRDSESTRRERRVRELRRADPIPPKGK